MIPFSFESTPVRAVVRDGEPWFVSSDVCEALTIGNNRDAISRLDDDERGVGTIDTLGGKQEVAIVNESGLYSLILTSRKPEAKRFKKWVTAEVIPSIRKSGGYVYSVPQTLPEALRLAADLAEQRNDALAKLEIAKPKAKALDRIATSSIGSMCITDAAKHIQVAPAVLFRWLAEHKWIYRRNGTNWIGYQDRIHEGLVEHKVTTIQMKETATSPAKEIISEQLRITAKGLAKLATVFSGQPRPRHKIGIVGMMRSQAAIAIAEFEKKADFSIWDYDSPQEKLSAMSHCDIVFVHTAHCAHTTEFKLDSIKANWVKAHGGVTSLRDAVARYLAE